MRGAGRIFIGILLAAGVMALASGRVQAAGGAFVVDDAAIDEVGACKVESSASFASNTDFIGLSTPACVVPFIRPVELGMIFARTRNDGEWGTSIVPKFKMNLLPVEVGKFGLAVSAGSQFDLLTGEYSGSFVNIPVTYTFSEAFKINVNGGWIYDKPTDLHFATYGAGFEWIPMKPFTIIGEVFGLLGERTEPRSRTDPRFQIGLRTTPIDAVDFDVIYGRNIGGENANWITLGMNVRFPVPGK
jgi:hypothetical protein